MPTIELHAQRETSALASRAAVGLPVILWDIDTRDWERLTAAQGARQGAGRQERQHHPDARRARTSSRHCPEIISGLRAKGFWLFSLDELLGLPWQPAFR